MSHIRRGPNNQILLTDAGAELLRHLQELHDSGLTMTEASDILRSNAYRESPHATSVSSRSRLNDTKPDHTHAQITSLQQELTSLRRRVAHLEQQLLAIRGTNPDPPPWWAALREEIDAP